MMSETKQECLTMPLLPGFSGCLVENPSCGYAVRFGFSYHCEHPRHSEFHPKKDSPVARVELPGRYRNLKETRRSQESEETRRLQEAI